MKEIKLLKPRELDVLIIGLYSKPVKGLESLRLFDKVLTALERVAVIEYDEDGNVLAFKRDEAGAMKLDSNGKPIRATYLKEVPCSVLLEDAYWQFLKTRLLEHEWAPQAGRIALDIIERVDDKDGDNGSTKEHKE